MKNLPLFPISLMGSAPRSEKVMKALRKIRGGNISKEDFNSLIADETKKFVQFQEDLGVDIITSGELARDNYVSFVSDKIEGVQMMNMSELLLYIDDKKSFENILNTLDVPGASIKNAICSNKLQYKGDIVANELKLLKTLTKKPIKITLPGPYLLTRSMWLPKLSGNFYNSKEALGEDIIKILKEEINQLQDIGVEVIQFDEPVLTEVVFTEGKPRTFMCAALSERKDPKEELLFARYLIKSVMDHVDKSKVIPSLHVCRGNWSKDENILLTGPYTPLLDIFSFIKPSLLALEFSTPRAGDLKSFLNDSRFPSETKLGLGVVNPRTDIVEKPEEIIQKIQEALLFLPKEKIWLNPDCGFATFANRPVNTYDTIGSKISSMVKAADNLRRKYE